MKNPIVVPAIILLNDLIATGQNQLEIRNIGTEPDNFQLIPDKVVEIAIPLIFIFIVLNILVQVLKHRAESQLKLKMIEKGVSEDTLVEIFRDSNTILRLQPLKWSLFVFASGLGAITINIFRDQLLHQSAYLSVGILLLFVSAALFVYYRLLSRKFEQIKPNGK